MKILITGTSKGIGKAVAERYLSLGHEVIGLDLLSSNISNNRYTHFQVDISNKEDLPEIKDVEVIFSNAGKQNDEDIKNNLIGCMNVIEKYAFNKSIKSVLINASASASTGQEFPEYVASKSALLGYMKNVAIRLARYGAVCNSISLGGVLTESNKPVTDDPILWNKVMEVTPLKKWMTLEEVCDFVIFLTLTNKSMSGQDILVDNGEKDLNPTFVWPTK